MADDHDTTDLAEALSLLASLIAAGISLWEQNRAKPKEEKALEQVAKVGSFLPKIVWLLAGVVGIQFLLLLFMAYKIF